MAYPLFGEGKLRRSFLSGRFQGVNRKGHPSTASAWHRPKHRLRLPHAPRFQLCQALSCPFAYYYCKACCHSYWANCPWWDPRLWVLLPASHISSLQMPPPSCVWEFPRGATVRAFCAPVPLQLVVKGNLWHVPILFNICSITVLFEIELLDLISLSEEFVHCHSAMDGKWFSFFSQK